MVQWKEWNLLGDLRPLGRFDIVFCRNVLIYFDQPTKTRAWKRSPGRWPRTACCISAARRRCWA